MNIKNYTSSVPVDQSILNIERLLAQAGASQIAKAYENQKVVGVKFQIVLNGKPVYFNIPCETKEFEEYMLAQYRKLTPAIEEKVKEQAARTAWKQLHEWIYIEVSRIIVRKRNPVEVFLSYVWDPHTDQTYFQKLAANNFKQLTMGNKEQ